MAEFQIEIAGSVFAVRSLFESTRDYCRNYLSEKTPEFSVETSPEDLVFEQNALDEEAREEGMKRRKFSDPFLERTAIQRKVAEHLFHRNVLLLHGSAVAVDGQGYLFTAACGTGKSTHTRFWRQLFGNRAVMVNDDKPFLQIAASGVVAYGSPWSGKHGLSSNICVPLRGICSLHRGKENAVQTADPVGLMALLRQQVHTPAQEALLRKTEQLLDRLAQQVPLWTMYCNQELSAAQVAYDAMR